MLAIRFIIDRVAGMNSSGHEVDEGDAVDEEAFVGQCLRLIPLLMRGMMKREANDLASGAMTMPQFGVLDFLHERGEAPMRGIADMLAIRPSNLTGIVDRLVALGLVDRLNDETDRRVVLVRITPAGEAALERISVEKRATMGRLYRCITPAERALYLRVMEKFLDELQRGDEADGQ